MNQFLLEYVNKIEKANYQLCKESDGFSHIAEGFEYTILVFNGFPRANKYAQDLFESQMNMMIEIKNYLNNFNTKSEKLNYLFSTLKELKKLTFIVHPSKSKNLGVQHEKLKGDTNGLMKLSYDNGMDYEGDDLQDYLEACLKSLNESIVFIEELITTTDRYQNNANLDPTVTKPVGIKEAKLKTNLTVDEIAVLFNLLLKLKLIESESIIGICRFISENFSSKERSDLSVNSLKNKMNDPDPKAIENVRIHAANLVNAAKDFYKK